jgi:hypothetical protein
MHLIDSLNINSLNKDDISSKLIDIRKEIENLSGIENEIDINEDERILKEIQTKLLMKKDEIEIDEKFRQSEKELNQLNNDVKNLKVQEAFRMWKNEILKKINDAFKLSKL